MRSTIKTGLSQFFVRKREAFRPPLRLFILVFRSYLYDLRLSGTDLVIYNPNCFFGTEFLYKSLQCLEVIG